MRALLTGCGGILVQALNLRLINTTVVQVTQQAVVVLIARLGFVLGSAHGKLAIRGAANFKGPLVKSNSFVLRWALAAAQGIYGTKQNHKPSHFTCILPFQTHPQVL